MPIKKYKPTTPGRRGMSGLTFEEITTSKPEKSLLAPKKSKGGRNNTGRITVRHQGAGHKKTYRIIDFKRNKDNIPAKVATIEYDPNRTANIALLNYADGEKRYIIAPAGLKVGMTVISGVEEDIKVGNYPKMSFAFTVAKDHYDRATHTRIVDKIAKVFDVSPVSFPANPTTELSVSTRDYFNGVIEAEKAERLEREKREIQKQRIRILSEV